MTKEMKENMNQKKADNIIRTYDKIEQTMDSGERAGNLNYLPPLYVPWKISVRRLL